MARSAASPMLLLLAAAALPVSALETTVATALFSWLSGRGGGAAVTVATVDGLRGLVTTRSARVGDVLLEVRR